MADASVPHRAARSAHDTHRHPLAARSPSPTAAARPPPPMCPAPWRGLVAVSLTPLGVPLLGSSGTFLPVKGSKRYAHCLVQVRDPDLPRYEEARSGQARSGDRGRRVHGPGRTVRFWEVNGAADAG